LEELRLVAEGNGGVANVPEGSSERKDLGKWCSKQARPPPPARQLTRHALHADGNQLGRDQYEHGLGLANSHGRRWQALRCTVLFGRVRV